MDIGATWKGKNNKGKGKKGHHKGKGKPSGKGKGYGNNQYYSNKGKGKHYGPIGQGNPFKGSLKGQFGKGKSSGSKGKSNNTTTCYKCGQQGHIARNCRVPIYNYTTSVTQHNKETQHTTGSTIHNSMMHLGTTKISLGKAMPNQHN